MMKASRVSFKGKAKIIESDSDKFVVKEKNKSLTDLFDYLDQRNFSSHPRVLEENDSTIKYKYVDAFKTDENDFHTELPKTISHLHSSTTYFKDVSRKKYKDIYNKLMDNVDFLKNEYEERIFNIDNERYMSPSSYLLARNYTLISTNLIFIEKELNKWYNLVKDKTKERVCVIHNNIKKDNFLKGEEIILTGWDNFLVDTPVLDLYKFYKNDFKSLDFEKVFNTYMQDFELTNEEKSLLKVLISMPPKINDELSEYEKVKFTKGILSYINKTSNLIKSGVFD